MNEIKTPLRLISILMLICLTVKAQAADSQTAHKHRPALATSPAVAPDGHLWIVGVDTNGRLFTQRTQKPLSPTANENGIEWAKPAVVPNENERVSADGQNRPKLLFLKDGRLLITYTTPLSKPYTGHIRYQFSSNAGQDWTTPRRAHQDNQILTHRFESLTQTADGTVHIAWIDKRDSEREKANGKPYRGAAIYRSHLKPGKDEFEPETKLADHTCECCHIAMTALQNGETAYLWRHVFEPNIRDHALMRTSEQMASLIQRATFDHWAVDACPHQGPAMTQAADGSLHAVWFGIRNTQAAVRYARLTGSDHDRHALMDTAQLLPDEDAEFADINATSDRIWIVWRRFDGKRWQLVAREGSIDGRFIHKTVLAHSDSDNDIPRLFTYRNQTWVLWRDTDAVRVIPLKQHPAAASDLNPSSKTVNRKIADLAGTSIEEESGADASESASSKNASIQPAPPAPFTEATWSDWVANSARPSVVLFTSSDCSHCPTVLKQIREQRRKINALWTLAIVQMDDEPYDFGGGTQKPAGESHWRFAGKTRQLQYSVNPQWRGMTPYIALMPSRAAPYFVLGAPTQQQLEDLK